MAKKPKIGLDRAISDTSPDYTLADGGEVADNGLSPDAGVDIGEAEPTGQSAQILQNSLVNAWNKAQAQQAQNYSDLKAGVTAPIGSPEFNKAENAANQMAYNTASGAVQPFEGELPKAFSVLTAERNGLSAEQNAARQAALRQDLDNLGLNYHEAVGNYEGGPQEHPFIVPHNDKSTESLINILGQRYGQESVLHHFPDDTNKLTYTSGPNAYRSVIGSGITESPNFDKNFTQIGDKKFQVGLDWDKFNAPQTLTHYSKATTPITEIDPEYMGQGAEGKESLRAGKIPRSYYYEENTEPENIVAEGTKYSVQRPQGIVDVANPDPTAAKILEENPDQNDWEKELAKSGYAGYKNTLAPYPAAVALFGKQKVIKKAHGGQVPFADYKGMYADGGIANSGDIEQPTPDTSDEAWPGANAPQLSSPAGPSLDTHVNVIDPDTGSIGSIPKEQLQDALQQGYAQPTPDQLTAYITQQKYGTPGQIAATAGEAVARGIAGPLATGAEMAAGVPPEEIQARKAAHPIISTAGEIAGLALPGVGLLGKGLGAVGEAAVEAANLAEPATTVAKIGSEALRAATETGVFSAQDEVSNLIMNPATPPAQAAQTAAVDIGLSSLLGGALGVPFAALSPLWESVSKSGLGSVLKSIANKMGGVDGTPVTYIDQMLAKTGIDVAPEVRAYLNGDSYVQNLAKGLEQSDTTSAGLAYQKALADTREKLGDYLLNTMGVDSTDVAGLEEFSPYEAGKGIGESLAKEYEEQIAPVKDQFDGWMNKYGDTPLEQSVDEETAEKAVEKEMGLLEKTKGPFKKFTKDQVAGQLQDQLQQQIASEGEGDEGPNPVPGFVNRPSTVSKLIDKIGQTAISEGWTTSPSSDIMQKVNNVIAELPLQKTVGDLTKFIQQVGNNFRSTNPMDRSLDRAGGLIKGILRDEETNIVGHQVGSEEGIDALNNFRQAQSQFKVQAELKEAIDSRLHAQGSVSNYAKNVADMANTDGETVLRRLSGKNDAQLLDILGKNFPNTAQLVRQAHYDQLVDTAIRKAKAGDTINANAFMGALNNPKAYSPELKQFLFTPDASEKIQAVGTILDELQKLPHNFSNTARTVDKLMANVPGAALGMVTMLLGHSPEAALVVGGLTKFLGKDVPDAAKLAMLKFLGSKTPIDAAGFKQATDFIAATASGENMVAKAAKNLFRADVDVLPQSAIPNQSDKAKLDKTLQNLKTDPSPLLNNALGKGVNYLPQHGQAMSEFTTNAVNYLNNLRPKTDINRPLDTKRLVSTSEKAAFERALEVAQQPIMVLKRVKDGNITTQDVLAIKTMYPDLYDRLQQKITNELTESVAKGKPIPYKLRLGLSVFMCEPLDSTMTPQAIIAAQPQQPMAQPATAQQPANRPKSSTSGLNKIPEQIETQDQAAERRRSSGGG